MKPGWKKVEGFVVFQECHEHALAILHGSCNDERSVPRSFQSFFGREANEAPWVDDVVHPFIVVPVPGARLDSVKLTVNGQ